MKLAINSVVLGILTTASLSLASVYLTYTDKPYMPTLWSRLLHPGYAVASKILHGSVDRTYIAAGFVGNITLYALLFFILLVCWRTVRSKCAIRRQLVR